MLLGAPREGGLVHVQVAAHLDLDGVDLLGGAAVVGGDEAAPVRIVERHPQAVLAEVIAHQSGQRRARSWCPARSPGTMSAPFPAGVGVAMAAHRGHRVSVDQDGETEVLAGAGQRPGDGLVVGGVHLAAGLPFVVGQGAGQGPGAGGGHLPQEAAPVDVARAGMSWHRAGRHVVGVPVQVADEAGQAGADQRRRRRRQVQLVDEQVGVAADVQAVGQRWLEPGDVDPRVGHADHHRGDRLLGQGRRRRGAASALQLSRVRTMLLVGGQG